MMLSVITTPPKPSNNHTDYSILLIDGYLRNLDRFVNCDDRDALKRAVYYGILFFSKGSYRHHNVFEAKDLFNLVAQIKRLIAMITPRELTSIYPIDKQYDGNRYECKDYFYTMNELEKHGMDALIGEAVEDVLWDYTNLRVRMFNAAMLGILDDLRRAEGKQGMIEEFFGIQPWIEHTDAKGKKYMVQKGTGKIAILKKKRPRYLRPVRH